VVHELFEVGKIHLLGGGEIDVLEECFDFGEVFGFACEFEGFLEIFSRKVTLLFPINNLEYQLQIFLTRVFLLTKKSHQRFVSFPPFLLILCLFTILQTVKYLRL